MSSKQLNGHLRLKPRNSGKNRPHSARRYDQPPNKMYLQEQHPYISSDNDSPLPNNLIAGPYYEHQQNQKYYKNKKKQKTHETYGDKKRKKKKRNKEKEFFEDDDSPIQQNINYQVTHNFKVHSRKRSQPLTQSYTDEGKTIFANADSNHSTPKNNHEYNIDYDYNYNNTIQRQQTVPANIYQKHHKKQKHQYTHSTRSLTFEDNISQQQFRQQQEIVKAQHFKHKSKKIHPIEQQHFKSHSTKAIHEVGLSHKNHHSSHGSFVSDFQGNLISPHYMNRSHYGNRIVPFKPRPVQTNNINNHNIHSVNTYTHTSLITQTDNGGLGFFQQFDSNTTTPILNIQNYDSSPTDSYTTTNTSYTTEEQSIPFNHTKKLRSVYFEHGYQPGNDDNVIRSRKQYYKNNIEKEQDSFHLRSRSRKLHSRHRSKKSKKHHHHHHKSRSREKRKEAIFFQAFSKPNGRTISHLDLIGNNKEYKKSKLTTKFLKDCLSREFILRDSSEKEIRKMVQSMFKIDMKVNEILVKQGEPGSAYFVIQKGILEQWEEYYPESTGDESDSDHIKKKMKRLKRLSEGCTFGAEALIYSAPNKHTYQAPSHAVNMSQINKSVKPEINRMSSSDIKKDILKDNIVCRVWGLDSQEFSRIRKQMRKKREDSKSLQFFKSIEYFKDLHSHDLQDIAQCAKLFSFKKGEKVVVEGSTSTHFYIIYKGTADVIKRNKKVASYKSKDSFGEKGIMTNKKRAATIIVTSDILKAYAITASDFKDLLKHETVQNHMQLQVIKYKKIQLDQKFTNIVNTKLNEFCELGVLGVGAFGRVTLVEDPKGTLLLNENIDDEKNSESKSKKRYKTYALKRIRKNRVVETGQQNHIINEKRIMAALNSPFCAKLYGTYKDELNVYFLLESILGGELFSLLRTNGNFNEQQARFYASCVVLAFEYLHNLNIIYRDLKPENLLINNNGYCKLVDFGFAKKRNESCTLCGTPQYLAPEVIQQRYQILQLIGIHWVY